MTTTTTRPGDRYDVHTPDARTQPYRPATAPSRPATPERAWPAVRILSAEIAPPSPLAVAPAGHRRVRVVIHLGRLRPADVMVHLTTGRARCVDASPADAWSVRLASTQSYGNGTFVFDGQVAERALDGPRRPVALVEPARGPDDAEPPESWTVRRLVARPLEWSAAG